MEAVELLEPIRRLLPLGPAPRCEPQLHLGADTGRRMFAALYRTARAYCICPFSLQHPYNSEYNLWRYGQPYFGWNASAEVIARLYAGATRRPASNGSRNDPAALAIAGATGVAVQVLHLFYVGQQLGTCEGSSDGGLEEALDYLGTAIRLLQPAGKRQECQQQLEEVAAREGLQVLSADQLLCACHCALARAAAAELGEDAQVQVQQAISGVPGMFGVAATPENELPGRLVPAWRQKLREAESSSIEELRRLEPTSARWLVLAAQRINRMRLYREAAELDERAGELARQQGSPFWEAHAALGQVSSVLAMAQLKDGYVDAEVLQQARGLVAAADAAMEQCRKVLPHCWTHDPNTKIEWVKDRLQQAERHLQRLEREDPVTATQEAEEEARQWTQRTQRSEPAGTRCDGCGEHAVGLRRCARCKQAWYCSKECQTDDWPDHRPQCIERPSES